MAEEPVGRPSEGAASAAPSTPPGSDGLDLIDVTKVFTNDYLK